MAVTSNLLQRLREHYAILLADQRQILRQAFADNFGSWGTSDSVWFAEITVLMIVSMQAAFLGMIRGLSRQVRSFGK